MRDSHTEPCFISFQQSGSRRTFALSVSPLSYTSRQLSLSWVRDATFSVRSLYLFECCLYYKGVFSECQRLSDCKYAKTVVHISLFFRHTTQCQTCTVLPGKLCDFHKRRRCSRMAVPSLRTLILYCAVICAVRPDGETADRRAGPVRSWSLPFCRSDLAAVPMQDLGFRCSPVWCDRHARGARDFQLAALKKAADSGGC